jgi:hypothetical protein
MELVKGLRPTDYIDRWESAEFPLSVQANDDEQCSIIQDKVTDNFKGTA